MAESTYKAWPADSIHPHVCPKCGDVGELAGMDLQLAGFGQVSVDWACNNCATMWTTEFHAKYSHRRRGQCGGWKGYAEEEE